MVPGSLDVQVGTTAGNREKAGRPHIARPAESACLDLSCWEHACTLAVCKLSAVSVFS